MSNINDNNLDDLLRRAAEKYPLRTDSANFTKLVADLEKDPSLILPPLNNEDKRRRRRFIWLFLLLPLGGGAYFAWHAAAGGAHTTEIARGAAPKELTGEGTAPGTKKSVEEKTGGVTGKAGNGEAGKVENEENGKTGNGGVTGTRDEKVRAAKDGKAGKVENSGVGIREVAKVENGEVGKARNSEVGKGGEREAAKTGNGREKNTIAGRGKVDGEEGTGNEVKGVGGVEGERINNRDAAINGLGKDKVSGGNLSATQARKVDGKLSLASTRGSVNVNIPVKGKTADAAQSATPQKDKIKLQKPKPSFYVGILGSPDLSTIRMQSVKSVGYNLGVLLGYSFNSRWAIETGLYYDRKKYYTDGEYFSKSKLPSWMSYYNIKAVDGYCNMLEIPLNVRYNFSNGDKMKWFATAGFSNYLMSKEVYTFDGTDSGGNAWNRTWPYKTPYKYWFSIVSLSAGFEQRLGKIGNLRLEPFVRVPLSGIGTGNLSIMSAGLNIGITRRIW